MELLWPYFVVFILAAIPLFEVIGVIPLGVLAGLPPIPVGIVAFLGNVVTILLLIFLVDHMKAWMKRRRTRKIDSHEETAASMEPPKEGTSKRSKRARKIWEKYGLPGLTIIGPLVVGSHLSAFMSMSFGSKKSWVTGWMIGSLLLWSTVTTAAAFYGIGFLNESTGSEGFLVDLIKGE
ncbi:small multi-drug export protein [Metabacillus arenae]|uniref:Small multi-drug export protein n=1 Tax=Metabacillus arenae TaxID=2771434 RepID=A0A926RX32_9BACI|nr:small multi-drug export protein [Metabacillus arenae]MBD1381423.1 small multi-drug export protein [Metabacillus arenae]